jgi:hypothetical protein
MKITKSNGFRQEYCGTVVKIGEILPIEGRDRIVKTMVNGLSIVIGKDEFQTGDVAVYCANETQLHELFLHLNSMYDDKELNIDKEKKGYINKHGRVRIVKLGGVPSYGILLNPTSIATFLNEPVAVVSDYLRNHVNEDFDEITERFSVRCMFRLLRLPTVSCQSQKEEIRSWQDSRCLSKVLSDSIMTQHSWQRICICSHHQIACIFQTNYMVHLLSSQIS